MSTTNQLPEAFEGNKPTHAGDRTLETQGMAPIPDDNRYGGVWRMFTVWFTPNMEVSGIFIGTLAVVFGLGFQLGLLAIILGVVVGAIPVALLCTWGPKTGTGQLPLARMPFGKSILLPSAVQWLSSVGWIALTGLFGGQAAHLLLHIPFWMGTLLVLALEATIAIFGYEVVHQAEKWGAAIGMVLFLILTVRIFQHHVVLPVNTLHGSALVGAFVLTFTVAVSGPLSWASYGSDFSRYMKPDSSTKGIFWFTMLGMCTSYVWVMTIGLAAASLLSDQTAGGIRTLMGGGVAGGLALLAIMYAAIVSCPLNDYSGSLAVQAFGIRIKRPIISAAGMIVAFALILWMNAGDTASKFQNLLLFTSYWIAPFCAIVMIDWHYNKSKYVPSSLRSALSFKNLDSGWAAGAAFVIGFAAMIPFMDTSIVVGKFAHEMKGADIAFYVGFVLTGVLYYVLRAVAIAHTHHRTTVKPTKGDTPVAHV